MKTYNDLNLKEIREKCDLDFAHYTYKKGQCSCCYGPMDLPAKYWRNGKKPPEYVPGTEKRDKDEKVVGGKLTEYTYLLFKNADNGKGTVTKHDEIAHHTCIGWEFPMDKMYDVCSLLLEQLDSEYYILMPKNEFLCIIICVYGMDRRDINKDGYYVLEKNTLRNPETANLYYKEIKEYQDKQTIN